MKYLLRRIETSISELEVEADSPYIARAIADNSVDWVYTYYDDRIQIGTDVHEFDVSDDTLAEIFERRP